MCKARKIYLTKSVHSDDRKRVYMYKDMGILFTGWVK